MQRPKFNEWIKEVKEESKEGKPKEESDHEGSHTHAKLQFKLYPESNGKALKIFQQERI